MIKELKISRSITERTPILNAYMQDISRYPLLSLNQEVELTYRARRGDEQAKQQLIKIIGRLSAIIAVLTVIALGGAWFIGIPVLSLLYSNISYALADCRPAFMLIILGGALNAFMNLFYYAMIIMKMQKYIFGVYGVVAVMAVLISTPFVRSSGIFGGALAYTILTAALVTFFGMFVLYGVMKKVRDKR